MRIKIWDWDWVLGFGLPLFRSPRQSELIGIYSSMTRGTISSIPLEDPGVDHILAHDLESVAGYVLYDRARDVVANLNHGLHQEIDVHGFQGGIQEPVSPLIFDPGPDGFYWVEKGGSDWEKKKDRTH